MTGWPDASKPGVPLNPEQDGWHWLTGATGTPAALEWRPSVLKPQTRGWYLHREQYGVIYAEEMAHAWRYLGPCLTPTEVAAQIAAARADGMRAAAGIAQILAVTARAVGGPAAVERAAREGGE